MAENQMFRQEAVDRLQSPEQLDQALRVVRRKDWIPLTVIFGLIAATGVWSVVGRIPETVDGTAILLTPTTVLPFQAPVPGQIRKWNVKVGDVVEQGQVLADLEQPSIVQDLRQAQDRLTEIRGRNEGLGRITAQSRELQLADIRRRRDALSSRISDLRSRLERTKDLTARLRKADADYRASRRAGLKVSRDATVDVGNQLRERVAAYERLFRDGLISKEALLQAQRSESENRLRLADLEVRLNELELADSSADKSLLDSESRLADQESEISSLVVQHAALETEEAAIGQRELELEYSEKGEIDELNRTIEQLTTRLERNRRLTAGHGGRILELTVAEGAVVAPGQRLGMIDTRGPDEELLLLAYFTVKDGKRVAEGMAAHASLETVQRERFGSMVARISSVSGYPVSAESAARYVGNGDVARFLTANGHQIEVFGTLNRDAGSPSGYEWTSGDGPDVTVTAGTTATVRVVIGKRAPITYVIPILRDWTGL